MSLGPRVYTLHRCDFTVSPDRTRYSLGFTTRPPSPVKGHWALVKWISVSCMGFFMSLACVWFFCFVLGLIDNLQG